jgi:hypothetical protein
MDNNAGAGPKAAVINGFTPGFAGPGSANTSWVDFNTDSWGTGYGGLVTGLGTRISTEGSHFASFSVISGTGNFDTTDVVAYEIGGPFGGAGAVAKSIVSNGGSFITLGLAAGNVYDLLVAYNNGSGGTNIADVQLLIENPGTTQGAIVENDADLAVLSGVGLGKIIGSVLGSNDVVHFNGGALPPSDLRLKEDIIPLELLADGLRLYRFRYKWSNQQYVGVMAQEVAETNPDAVVCGADGYLRVDYGRLGLPMMTWDEWVAKRQKP